MANHGSQILALTKFFERLTETELRAVMLRVGERALLEMPGRSASQAEAAQRAAEIVVAHGALDTALLGALLELRPRSRPAIGALAAAAGIAAPPRSGVRSVLSPGMTLALGGAGVCAWAIYTGRFVTCEPANERSDLEIEVPVVKMADREALTPADPVAVTPPGLGDVPPSIQRPTATSPRPRARDQPRATVATTSVPVAGKDTPTPAPVAGARWTVSRVEGKRLVLSDGVLPPRGLLRLVAPADGRRFVSDVQCRIEEAPGTCWLVALPGNDLPRAGDVFVRAPAEAG